MPSKVVSVLKANIGVIGFLVGLFVFRAVWADWNRIPSGSMEPTLYPGDVVFVDKTAYGASLPFAHIKLLSYDTPKRGDIITFIPPHTDTLFVKRVVGVPGDVLLINGKDVFLNGNKLPYNETSEKGGVEVGMEDMVGIKHLVQYSDGGQQPVLPGQIVVPEGKLFVMGDHRTNSADSRFWGFVDVDHVMGKVNRLALSFSDKRGFVESLMESVN